MSPAQSNDNNFSWYNSLDEIKADGLSAVRVTSPLCFYRLVGKKTVLASENIEPISGIYYAHFADNKFYVKEFRGWDLGMFYWYRKSMTFSGEDQACEILRGRIAEGSIWLLFNKEQISDMSAMLARVYSSQLKDQGKVPHRLWISLLHDSLMYEDYKRVAGGMVGFKTACKMFEQRITDIWKQVKEQQR